MKQPKICLVEGCDVDINTEYRYGFSPVFSKYCKKHKYVKAICPQCGQEFPCNRVEYERRIKQKRIKGLPACSKSCGLKVGHKVRTYENLKRGRVLPLEAAPPTMTRVSQLSSIEVYDRSRIKVEKGMVDYSIPFPNTPELFLEMEKKVNNQEFKNKLSLNCCPAPWMQSIKELGG